MPVVVIRQYAAECDSCFARSAPVAVRGELDEALRADGWRTTARRTFCPVCKAKGAGSGDVPMGELADQVLAALAGGPLTQTELCERLHVSPAKLHRVAFDLLHRRQAIAIADERIERRFAGGRRTALVWATVYRLATPLTDVRRAR